MADAADLLTAFLGGLAEIEALTLRKAVELRGRPDVVEASRHWFFADSGHLIEHYVEIEVPEGCLTWALALTQDRRGGRWTLERALTRNFTEHQEELYAFPREAHDAQGLARRLPEAVRELLAREHEAT